MLKHWEAMSDEALAFAAKQAEEKAFSVLVERLLDEVLRLLDLVLVWVEVPRLLV